MHWKFFYLIIASFFVLVFLVAAVTLTKESTEKVIVTKAYRVSIDDSANPGFEKVLVFGYADIYAKDAPDQIAARLAIFVYDGVIYRSTGFRLTYDQDDGLLVIREDGGGSIVNNDGTEQNDAFDYFIDFDTSGEIDEMEFKFSGEDGRVLKMKEVLRVVEEPIEWRPE